MAKLLVVDDEPDIRDLVAKRLVSQGHLVLPAGSGLAALLLVQHHGMPDAAILDIDMPGMDGFELLTRLRDLSPGLPVLFLTVLWLPEVKARMQVAGVAHLPKPCSTADLRAGVRRLLALPGGATTPGSAR